MFPGAHNSEVKESVRKLDSVLKMAQKKRLIVRQNVFKAGWSIMPACGSVYCATTTEDMVSYVKGY